jgi:hypothetical protein
VRPPLQERNPDAQVKDAATGAAPAKAALEHASTRAYTLSNMKITPPMAAAAAVAAALCLGLAYAVVKVNGNAGEIAQLRGDKAALEARVASLKATVDSLLQQSKQAESTIGENGTLQVLARGISSGEMDLSLRSLKVVSGGKALVTLGSATDQGGTVTVASADGSSSAVLASSAGKSRITFRSDTGSDAAHLVQLASFGNEGYSVQRGPTDKDDAATAVAGLRIQDSGASIFASGHGSGTVSMDAPAGDAPATLNVIAEADASRRVTLSTGPKDATPSVSVSGSPAGLTLWLVPDRLTLVTKDGGVALGAAQDENGGFVFVNAASGVRRAIMTAGAQGQGSVTVYSDDKKTNTFYPVFNLQQAGASQK